MVTGERALEAGTHLERDHTEFKASAATRG